jgi:hypothetical protein
MVINMIDMILMIVGLAVIILRQQKIQGATA